MLNILLWNHPLICLDSWSNLYKGKWVNTNKIDTRWKNLEGISWIDKDNQKNGRGFSKEEIDKLYSWSYNNPQVVNYTMKNYHVNIKYHRTGGTKKTQKLIIQI